MSLVQVPCGRLDAEPAQGPHAADPEHDLLAEPHLATADVEDVGDRPVAPLVGGDIGVQQEERHATHLRQPDRGVDLAIREVDAHL